MKRLSVNAIAVSPLTFNALPIEAIVENGAITLNRQTFAFENGDAYPEGTKVLVQIGRGICCQSIAEIEQEKDDREKRRVEAQLEAQSQELERASVAKAFNDALGVPVGWSPEVKHVLSGLSDVGWGDGRRKNTKVHIYLRESLEGQLKRSANSFLCTPSTGAHYNEHIDRGNSHQEAVTCPHCLKIAKRWQF